ncbi:DUF3303 domain-containing protein [Synechococcus sp. CC9616]|jgi:hypothetical protein|uniref:DUF3303 domain-containing protein n=1 Tax=Synechococcus sp. CC9616 TaxID=110663 RepID=UPI00048E7C76|nr:DUF3303 domain-containing protein [Synechococcus sp. CC9616]RPF82321.1 MAG: DUF3303 domain-containing protein [Synechococcus sp. TMED20]|tara:strand:- start:458 stop:778 length:321 start_codon:yes stop_codon:yes gene_type:complete
MQLYLADIQFDDIDMQKAAYAQFIELWESGAMAKEDKFEGFEMLFRVHAPGEGRVVVLCRAESDKQLFAHFAPWRAQFGMVVEFTPVISCQNVVDYHKDLFAKLGG